VVIALDRGLDRDRASANKQFVVRDQLLGPGEIGDQELAEAKPGPASAHRRHRCGR
jgi:hypothetical protein